MTYPQQTPQPQPAAGGGPEWPYPRPGAPRSPSGAPSTGYSIPPGAYPGYGPAHAPAVAPSGEPLAEFSDRLLARLVDAGLFFLLGLILEVPVIIVILMAVDSATLEESPDPFAIMAPILGAIAVMVLLSLLASYLYEVEMILRSGQTVGKRVMKIRVATLDGSPLTRGIAAKRWAAGSLAASFIPAYQWIDGLWQLWDKPYRQCLHDKFATTTVVRSPAGRIVPVHDAPATGAA